METNNDKLTASTITADQIAALQEEAGQAGDHSMHDVCTAALRAMRDRGVGMTEWTDRNAPRSIRRCVDVINEARGMADE